MSKYIYIYIYCSNLLKQTLSGSLFDVDNLNEQGVTGELELLFRRHCEINILSLFV